MLLIILGEALIEWMECKLSETDLINHPMVHPRIKVSPNISRVPSIKEKSNVFCEENSCKLINVGIHHITLRSMNEKYHFLSSTSTSNEEGLFSFFLCLSDEYFLPFSRFPLMRHFRVHLRTSFT